MKYSEAKHDLLMMGCKLLTIDEFATKYNRPTFFPYGCLNCGKAKCLNDFDGVYYFVCDNERLLEWAQRNGGVTSSDVNYGVIAKCKRCGHCDLYLEL